MSQPPSPRLRECGMGGSGRNCGGGTVEGRGRQQGGGVCEIDDCQNGLTRQAWSKGEGTLPKLWNKR